MPVLTRFEARDAARRFNADVHELRQLTNAFNDMRIRLRESELRFRQLVENIGRVFWIWDPKDQAVYVSPAFADIWGRSPESVRDDPSAWNEYLHPDDRERVTRQMKIGIEAEIDLIPDGEAALDHLQNNDCRPDLVLLDIRLARIDGLEVLREFKRSLKLKRVPVVVLSTSTAASDVQGALDLHANSYIVKPEDFIDFRKMIVDLASYWLNWNQSSPS